MAGAPSAYEAEIGQSIAKALEELLSKKHLYQSLKLPFDVGRLRFDKGRVEVRTEERFACTERLRYLEALWMPCWSESDSQVAEERAGLGSVPLE